MFILVATSCIYLHCIIDIIICNCLSSPGSCPGQSSVRRPSGLQYEINLVIIIMLICIVIIGIAILLNVLIRMVVELGFS